MAEKKLLYKKNQSLLSGYAYNSAREIKKEAEELLEYIRTTEDRKFLNLETEIKSIEGIASRLRDIGRVSIDLYRKEEGLDE